MSRNENSYFSRTPTLHFPRTRFKFNTVKRLQSQRHGSITPFFIDIVYPGDTWQLDTNIFCRADTSLKVPLDDIKLDIYYFFVPFRIIDKDFSKILGDVEPYDDSIYSFPTVSLKNTDDEYLTSSDVDLLEFLPGFLNWSCSTGYIESGGDQLLNNRLNAYPIMAYNLIWNEFFRDENLDASVDLETIKGSVYNFPDGLAQDYMHLKVANKFHDYFTSGLISPQKGPTVTIPLGTTAPIIGSQLVHDLGQPLVFGDNIANGGSPSSTDLVLTKTGTLKYGNVYTTASSVTTQTSANNRILTTNLEADLTNATAASINQFALSLKIQQLYERRGLYGTRYIETIRGQWGIEVPDALFERPEYLGGTCTTLNMVPVLNTTSEALGSMAGNSATLFNDKGFTKSFVEYGFIIGLSVPRINHTYTQGKAKRIWNLRDGLDLYNPVFANIGLTPVYKSEIFNSLNSDYDDVVFNYQEAWADLRTGQNTVAGVFAPYQSSAFSDLRTLWSYADYYESVPSFNSSWLKEDPSVVFRTMSGEIIPESVEPSGHQYIFAYYSHPIVTRELPSHSRLNLTLRY